MPVRLPLLVTAVHLVVAVTTAVAFLSWSACAIVAALQPCLESNALVVGSRLAVLHNFAGILAEKILPTRFEKQALFFLDRRKLVLVRGSSSRVVPRPSRCWWLLECVA